MPSSEGIDFSVCVVLPAGGHGERMDISMPKQFYRILDKPLFAFTLQSFNRISWIQHIIVAVPEEYVNYVQEVAQKESLNKVCVTSAGSSRHRSIYNGIKHIPSVCEQPDIIIIHDAVRPFAEEEVVANVALAAKSHGAAGVTRPLVSTVIAVDSENILTESLDRSLYRASEMPQGFKYELIRQAYEKSTDYDFDYGTECMHLVYKYANTRACLVEGPASLWKVTYKKDLYSAEGVIKENLIKVGLVGIQDAALEMAIKTRLEGKCLETSSFRTLDSLPKHLTSLVVQLSLDKQKIRDTSEEISQNWKKESGRFFTGGTIVYLLAAENHLPVDMLNFSQTLVENLENQRISPFFIITKKTHYDRAADIVSSLIWEASNVYAGQLFYV